MTAPYSNDHQEIVHHNSVADCIERPVIRILDTNSGVWRSILVTTPAATSHSHSHSHSQPAATEMQQSANSNGNEVQQLQQQSVSSDSSHSHFQQNGNGCGDENCADGGCQVPLVLRGDRQVVNEMSQEELSKMSAVEAAACQAWPQVYKKMQEENFDVNLLDHNNNTALHWACWFGNAEIARELINKGAQLYPANAIGEQPVHFAAKSDKLNCLAALVIADPRILVARDDDGFSAMHHCAQKDAIGSMEWLYLNGAPLNQKDNYGFTPLHWAVYSGNVRAAQWLLSSGAAPDIYDNENCSILHWVAIKGKAHILEMLHKVFPWTLCDPRMYRTRDKSQQSNVIQLAKHRKGLSYRLRLYLFCLEWFGRLPPDALFVCPSFTYVIVNALNVFFLHYYYQIFTSREQMTVEMSYIFLIQFSSHMFSIYMWYKTVAGDAGSLQVAKSNSDAVWDAEIEVHRAEKEMVKSETSDPALLKSLVDKIQELARQHRSGLSAQYLATVLEEAPKCFGTGHWLPKVCVICGHERLPRVKHCKDTGHCIERFDHYCPWVNNSVGASNHRFFVWFLMSLLTATVGHQIIAVTYFSSVNIHVDVSTPWFYGAMINFILNIIWFFFVLCMCSRQWCITAGDVTEYELLREPDYIRDRKGSRDCMWYLRDRSLSEISGSIWHMLMSDRMSLKKKHDGMEMQELNAMDHEQRNLVVDVV